MIVNDGPGVATELVQCVWGLGTFVTGDLYIWCCFFYVLSYPNRIRLLRYGTGLAKSSEVRVRAVLFLRLGLRYVGNEANAITRFSFRAVDE